MTAPRARAGRGARAERGDREFAALPPGVVKVRLTGDSADVITAILAAHPGVEIVTGPDRYSGDRQYLLVKVAAPVVTCTAEVITPVALPPA